MTYSEKQLYHQIHPLKLATDITASIFSLYFFWVHSFIIGLILHLVPPIIASYLVMKYADLGKLKKSRTGKYVNRYMNNAAVSARTVGDVITVFGVWARAPVAIAAGAFLIFAAWFYGLVI